MKVPSESKSKKNKQCSTEPGNPKSKHGESTDSDAKSRGIWIGASRNIHVWQGYRFCSVDSEWQMDKCFSYLINGSEEHHMAVRSAFMPKIESVFRGNAQQYITDTGMDRSGTWGNTEEVLGLSHLLNTPVYSYVPSTYNWTRLSPDVVDLTQHAPITQKSIYIQNQHMHFIVIMSALLYNTQ